ncbi:serine/threonine-protein phosphatase 6 regulatory ankyrin repeat subunit B isoform X2 [Nasonia vitripennis]|uniref:Uncharacterized protein n=1 Tax=Nasonia vitripennis TaxID=7425 RepID=A0A7M7QEM5_NASVI|nr:serine/threonine-protein phosphatase 6 regulatory ankyrin repeat subunit B isoform X2 [Nasonia vitripennis]
MATKLGIMQFIRTVRQGDIATVQNEIRQYGLPKGGSVYTDYTALQAAFECRRYEIAKLLVSAGCRINPNQSDKGLIPLMKAIVYENNELVEMLLKRKANITSHNTTVLHLAAERRLLNMLQLILSYNVDVNAVDSSDIAIIKLLLSKRAKIEFKDYNGVNPLHFAVKLNDMKVLQQFVQACPDVNVTDKDGNTILHILVSMTNINSQSEIGIVGVVKMLIRKGARIDIANKHKENVSHLAAKHKKLDIMKIIPHNETTLNETDSEGNTVFHLLFENSLSFVKDQEFMNVFMHLLSLGIIIDTTNSVGKTPLQLAAENRQDQILHILLPYANIVGLRDNQGNSLLHCYLQSIIDYGTTSCEDNLAIVQILLNKGAEVDATNVKGISPVHMALKLRDRDIVLELLERINNADLCDIKGRSLLHFLAANKYKSRTTSNSPENPQESIEIAKKILAKNATIDKRDNRKRTPLHVAVTSRQSGLVQLLLEHGADPNAVDEQDDNALQFLVNSQSDQPEDLDVSIAEMLITKGANVNAVSKENLSLLHTVARKRRMKLMQGLLQHCSKEVISLKDHQGNTVLHMLMGFNKPRSDAELPNLCIDVAMKLLTKAGDMLVNEPNAMGETPLHRAAREKHDEILQILLLNGADPFICDITGNTVLHSLASPQSSQNQSNIEEQIVEIFVKKGCLIDAVNQAGLTPLHVAIKNGNAKVVAALVASGAEIHRTVGENLSTALHLSVECGNIEIANVLLRNGSNVNAVQSNGKTCLHLAAARKRFEMIKTLLENRADPDVQDLSGNTALHVACWYDDFETATQLLDYGADINIVNSKGSTALLFSQGADNALKSKLLYYGWKLRTANLPLASLNLEYIRKSLAEFHMNSSSIYDEELLEMERYQVDAQTNVADVLRMPASRLVVYKAKLKFRQLIFESEEFAQKFPHYADIIRANYRKGIARSELECSAKKAFNALCQFICPDICCEKILRNLNNEQLRSLIKAGKLKVNNKKRFLRDLDEEFERPAKRTRRINV